MCGICGLWGSTLRFEALGAMVDALRHRGPDDEGTYVGRRAALGMTRLAVIDQSTNAHQPMCNADRTIWVVYNGEMYNFREERRLLEAKGQRFASASDTEVVLRLYEEYGDDFVQRMRGMFALAVFDARAGPGRERLLVARDPFGIKPLLVARFPGGLAFASEMKALLASGLITREIDPVGLRLLLTFGSVAQPHSLVRGVEMLPAAHRLVVDARGERLERYWRLGIGRRAGLRSAPYVEQVAALADSLEDSVRAQMVSDVPVGAFLSGGVDSSVLVALMSRVRGRPIKTFSVGFMPAEGAEIDETEDAEATARYLGTNHTRVLVTGVEVRDCVSEIARGLDQPSVDGVNSFFVSQAARKAVTVAISGTGGDELFGGYPWFQTMQAFAAKRRARPLRTAVAQGVAWVAARRILDPHVGGGKGEALKTMRDRGGFLATWATQHVVFGDRGAAALLAAPLRREARAGRALADDLRICDELPEASVVDRVTGLCLRGYTMNQLLRDIDAVSMWHSLEVRVPFLDPLVADTALSLAPEARLGPTRRGVDPVVTTYADSGAKRVLIDVARGLLPPGFDRKPKRGFALPLDAWLRGPLREVVDDTLSERVVRARGLVDPEAVAVARRSFDQGYSGWARPWLLVLLEVWCREVLDAPTVAPRSTGILGAAKQAEGTVATIGP